MARHITLQLSEHEAQQRDRRAIAQQVRADMWEAARLGEDAKAAALQKQLLNGDAHPDQRCGDREFLQFYMGFIVVKTASENARYAKIHTLLDAAPDNGVLAIDEDDWKWLKDHLDKVDLSQKSPQGDIIFKPELRLRLAQVYIAVEEAKRTLEAAAPAA